MIVGIGTDLVDIDRIARVLERFGNRFSDRILDHDERCICSASATPARFLAKRFAAKEAAAKALGRGMAEGISWQDFGVLNDARGAPQLHLDGAARRLAAELGVTAMHISISDETRHAIAFVVMESA